MSRLPLVLLVAALALPGCDAEAPDDPLACAVSGAPGVTYTTDGGQTLAANASDALPFVLGLAALDDGALVAAVDGQARVSRDDGCTWAEGGELGGATRLSGGGDAAYAWGEFADAVVRVERSGETARRALPLGVASVVGLGADGDRVRIGADDGRLYASTDGGRTWVASGTAAPSGAAERLVYRVAFDSADLDRALLAQLSGPDGPGSLWRTGDGGRTWAEVALDARASVYDVSFATRDVAWAFGRRFADGVPVVLRSDDGGRSFETATEARAGVLIPNGPPHAGDRDGVSWSVYESQTGLATLYRYEGGAVTSATAARGAGYGVLLASPSRAGVLYLGSSPGARD